MASENFKIVLEQARSMGVGAILANQVFEDLKTADTDLRPTVQTNTRLKMVFSATDVGQQDLLMKGSGERVYEGVLSAENLAVSTQVSPMSAFNTQGMSLTTGNQLPRISRNTLIEISDDPNCCLFHVTRGSGYTQFSGYSIPVWIDFTVPREVYELRSTQPWPAPSPQTIVTRGVQTPEHSSVQDASRSFPSKRLPNAYVDVVTLRAEELEQRTSTDQT